MKTVDVRGLQCPLPIIETRKGLRELPEGESLKILIDNSASLGNVCKFLEDNNCSFVKMESGSHFELTVARGAMAITGSPAGEYCSTSRPPLSGGKYVVVLSTDTMGTGDDNLGRKLMASFVNILTELDGIPSAVLCYNGGVRLALPDSPVAGTLAELENRGVEIILCGTCLDFYGIKGITIAGKTGDMYRIASVMAAAQRVIRP